MENKQIEFERNEISEILAQNFYLNGEKGDASDFEWSAHCVLMAGYRKASEVASNVIDEFIEKVCEKYDIWTEADEREYHYMLNLMEITKDELKKKYTEKGKGK